MSKASAHPNEKTAQFLWTVFILMFFVIQAVIWTIAITVTATDSSHAVVADYDEMALKWDEVKRMQNESASLGWKCEIVIGDTADVLGNRNLTLTLNDSNQSPVKDVTVELTAFHCAHAANKLPLTMTETEPGVFSAVLPVKKFGRWQFDGKAFNEHQLYLIDQELKINRSPGR